MEDTHITITGIRYYNGLRPFSLNNIVKLIKEPNNPFDTEAIAAHMPIVGHVGYVANSPVTMANGTMSAGRAYDKISSTAFAHVIFSTRGHIICLIDQGHQPDLSQRFEEQAFNGRLLPKEDDVDDGKVRTEGIWTPK